MSFTEEIFEKLDHDIPAAQIHKHNHTLYKQLGQRAHELGIKGRLPHQALPVQEWKKLVSVFLERIAESYREQWERQHGEEPVDVVLDSIFDCAVRPWLIKELEAQQQAYRNYAARESDPPWEPSHYCEQLVDAANQLQHECYQRIVEGVASKSSPTPNAARQAGQTSNKRPSQASTDSVGEPNLFRKQGDFYIVRFRDEGPSNLRPTKGLNYIACLLRNQGKNFDNPLQFIAAVEGAGTGKSIHSEMTEAQLQEEGLATQGSSESTGPDLQALRAYNERLEELKDEIEDAEKLNDHARLQQLSEEKEFLLEQVGQRAERSKWSPEQKRGRTAIGNAIKRSLVQIRNAGLKQLCQHLDESIKPSSFTPGYVPNDTIDWDA